mgnify:FL=1
MPLSKAKQAEYQRERRARHSVIPKPIEPVLLLPERTLTNAVIPNVIPKLGYYNPQPFFGHVKNKMYADKFFKDVCSNL